MMISVQLEPKDLTEAYKLHKRWGPWMWSINSLYTAGLVGFGLWLILWAPSLLLIAIVLIVIAVLFWIFLAFVKFVLIPQVAQKRFMQQKGLQRPCTLSWNEDTFSMESPTGVSHTPWLDFLKWREDEHLFLIYSTPGMFRIVPKRALGDSNEITAFRNLLQEHIGPENKRRQVTNGQENAKVAE